MRFKSHSFGIKIQVHGRIFNQSGFVQIEVHPVVAFQHQRGLYGRIRYGRHRGIGAVALERGLYRIFDLRDFGFGIVVFLGIKIPGNPPGGMIAVHRKLCFFVLNHKINQIILRRKLIAKAQTIVK